MTAKTIKTAKVVFDRDMTKRSADEVRTLELFSEEMFNAIGLAWTTERQLVAMVWRACWSQALTAERCTAIGAALAGYNPAPDLQPMLDLMVEKRMLRRYKKQGNTLYEVNY